MLTRMACDGFDLISTYIACLKSLMLKRMACDGYYTMSIYMPRIKILFKLNSIRIF